MDYHEILTILTNELQPARFRHSRDVCQTAVRLAEHWDADIEKCRIAGILHDCARNLKGQELLKTARNFGLIPNEFELIQPALIHASLGALIAEKRFGVTDPEVLQAIRRHTTGSTNMTKMDKIIYLADCIEPGRHYAGMQRIREIADKNLNEAVMAAFDHSILFVIAHGGILHPNSIEGRNCLLMEMKAKRDGK